MLQIIKVPAFFFFKVSIDGNILSERARVYKLIFFSLIRKPSFVLPSFKFCLQFGCKPNFVHLKPRKYAVIYKGKWYLNPCWEGKPWSCVLEKVCNDLYRCLAVTLWQCHQARLEGLKAPPVSSPNPVNLAGTEIRKVMGMLEIWKLAIHNHIWTKQKTVRNGINLLFPVDIRLN